MAERNAASQINDCLSAERRVIQARNGADALLAPLKERLIADVRDAIARYNASALGEFAYEEHETKVGVHAQDGEPALVVAVVLGNFTVRANGRTLMPRDAWDIDESRLTGDLERFLVEALPWGRACRIRVDGPMDYDMMSADPEL